MSAFGLRLAGPSPGGHPALVSRRIHDLYTAALTGVIALAIAIAISLAIPNPDVVKILAIAVGSVAVFALMISTRYALTLTILTAYLGLLDGPVKLLTASQSASSA